MNCAIVLSEVMNAPPSSSKFPFLGLWRIRKGQNKDLPPIYAETCPQYVRLTDSRLQQPNYGGAKCVRSSPGRPSKENLERVWNLSVPTAVPSE
ncbi:hypothetical protein V1525DRAFT_391471 [Lipomyces kononenkoae]|uniref:Uncharacterized protein n=1 Tax=Lipomyces kononenkoae TaxID=34357 RepID=A0ACC3SS50_LIPKO